MGAGVGDGGDRRRWRMPCKRQVGVRLRRRGIALVGASQGGESRRYLLRWATVAAGSQANRAESRAYRAEPRARFSEEESQQAEPGSARYFPSRSEPSLEPARLGSIPPLGRTLTGPAYGQPMPTAN